MTQRTGFGRRLAVPVAAAAVAFGGLWAFGQQRQQRLSSNGWEIHDEKRPRPEVITPPTPSTQEQAGKPPSDAVVLFGGKEDDLKNWTGGKWTVKDGDLLSGKGQVVSKEQFGDAQIHVEFATPTPAEGKSQGRGNSGVFLMGDIEIQVLDSYQNETYADGQASAVYGQYPPLVNASRPPGQFQTYDIIFHAPRFGADGKLERKATVTVLHNGVLVQDHVEVMGPTGHHMIGDYKPGKTKGPLALQDHGNPIHFRNIWIRDLSKPGKAYETRPGAGSQANAGGQK
jgi:hypothetical protein